MGPPLFINSKPRKIVRGAERYAMLYDIHPYDPRKPPDHPIDLTASRKPTENENGGSKVRLHSFGNDAAIWQEVSG